MSPLEASILVSLGRWFCCCCLAWSLSLSTHQSDPETTDKQQKQLWHSAARFKCFGPVSRLTCLFNTKCFPFQYLSICRDCRVLTMSTGLTAVSWLISAHHRKHTCSVCSHALWFRVMVSGWLVPHLWWRSPCLGNCTYIAAIPPSSSYGSWWGPGQTGVSRVSLPSPLLWTAGSLKVSKKNLSAAEISSSTESERTPDPCVTYWSQWASCQSPASCTVALSGCTTRCSSGRNSSPEGLNICITKVCLNCLPQ